MTITLLAGGVGAAKLVQGFARSCDPCGISIVSNTGDDIELHGLWISPDVDTMLYTLAGVADPVRGWGIQNDTFKILNALSRMGKDTWFRLGDRDLATHLLRTRLLKEGSTPTQITRYLASCLSVQSHVLPMTDQKVLTEVHTPEGWMPFQEFFVKREASPEILDVAFRGSSSAAPTREVVESIRTADAVVICPSNPIASIGPIMALPGMKDLLKSVRTPRVAVSCIVGGKSLKGPSDRMLRAKGFSPDALGVARCYHGLIDGLVIDHADAHLEESILKEGIRVLVTDTLMPTQESKDRLAMCVLDFVKTFYAKDKHRRSHQEPVLR